MLKAQYGITASADSDVVTNWVSATGTWQNPASSDVPRIKAIRIVVVSRSAEPAASVVSSACTNANGIANTGPCSFQDAESPVIDLSNIPVMSGKTWQNYRYRVYQSVIPLRNVLWSY
jgi:type IV pilus assembly protein PilW